jgi:hypothetical protein
MDYYFHSMKSIFRFMRSELGADESFGPHVIDWHRNMPVNEARLATCFICFQWAVLRNPFPRFSGFLIQETRLDRFAQHDNRCNTIKRNQISFDGNGGLLIPGRRFTG